MQIVQKSDTHQSMFSSLYILHFAILHLRVFIFVSDTSLKVFLAPKKIEKKSRKIHKYMKKALIFSYFPFQFVVFKDAHAFGSLIDFSNE